MLDSNLDSHEIMQGCRKAEVEAASGARWLALRGPADHHEFFAVQAFHLPPQAAIAGRMGASMRLETMPSTDSAQAFSKNARPCPAW